jgi:hypothetical protein
MDCWISPLPYMSGSNWILESEDKDDLYRCVVGGVFHYDDQENQNHNPNHNPNPNPNWLRSRIIEQMKRKIVFPRSFQVVEE